MNDFLRLLDDVTPEHFASDPRPGWAGPDTLFGAPQANPLAPPECEFVAAGIPIDATASSRPGASEGPRAIRVASGVFSSYIDSLGEHEMLDTRTGQVFRYQRPTVADVGDLHIYPTNPHKNFQAIATEVEAIAKCGACLLLLGGDHSVAFPNFVGVGNALRLKDPHTRLGYIQIDHHFDFGMHSAIHGSLYHGSNARRISELPDIAPQQMAFVGVGSVTRRDQFESLHGNGYGIVPAKRIREDGPEVALSSVFSQLMEQCSAVYLSIDIDVLDCSQAPGTGNVTVDGLGVGQLFDLVALLRKLPLVAVDIVEVSPRYDPTGRTAQIAAMLLFDLIFRNPLQVSFLTQLAEGSAGRMF